MQKGAIQLNSKAVNIGPNVRYYASRKRDRHLIAAEAPQAMPEASLRRLLLAKMGRDVTQQVGGLGLLGLAGAVLHRKNDRA